MTPQEFKAWFEGFTEAFAGVPTKAQWARVKERVGEIDGKPVTERVFVDRYWPAYPRPYWSYGMNGEHVWTAYSAGSAVGSRAGGAATLAGNNTNAAFCSSQAMAALGRADAKSLAA